MLVLTPSERLEKDKAYDIYKQLYSLGTKMESDYFLPPFSYRLKKVAEFNEMKVRYKAVDNMEYLENRGMMEVATKMDVNILTALASVSFATEGQIIKILEAEKRICLDKSIGDMKERKLDSRLKTLARLGLVGKVQCYAHSKDTGVLERVADAPIAYVITIPGFEFLRYNKLGVVLREKRVELFGAYLFSSRLLANSITEHLCALDEYRGAGNRRVAIRRVDDMVKYGVDEWEIIDGCLLMEFSEGEVSVGVISVMNSFEPAIETEKDIISQVYKAAIVAREFIARTKYKARVIFACENMDAVGKLVKAMTVLQFSERGYSEYCYITAQPVVRYLVANEKPPYASMLQLAYDEEKEENYLTSSVIKFREPRVRKMRQKTEENDG